MTLNSTTEHHMAILLHSNLQSDNHAQGFHFVQPVKKTTNENYTTTVNGHRTKQINKRSITITDRFTCTSANVIYCITCTLCKRLYIGKTWRRLGDWFREHLHDVEKDNKNASKPFARHFNFPNYSKQHMAVCDLFLRQGSTESCNTLEQKFIFLIGTLNPHSVSLFHITRDQPVTYM